VLPDPFGKLGKAYLCSGGHGHSVFRQISEEALIVHAADHGVQQQSCRRAIRNTMIKGKAEDAGMTDSDLVIKYHWALRDSADS
jgi:hypothetical protein